MLDTNKFLERFLQKYRFKKIIPYLKGDVLDFGGNKGELRQFVSGNYWIVNYDHSFLDNLKVDVITCLAVIEHISVDEVHQLFYRFYKILRKDGLILITTPTKIAHPVLKILALLGLLDKENIEEHKHYWSKDELFDLALKTGYKVIKYEKFQLIFNQLIILKKV